MTTYLHVRDTDKGSAYEDRGSVVEVAFGNGTDVASTTVTGKPWVTTSTRFTVAIVGTSTRSVASALLQSVQFGIDNVVSGVGFDVVGCAPSGASGTFTVHVVGV